MELQRARRILLCLRYGIGDVVMETPVLDALRRTAPVAWITGITARPAQQLLDHDPRLDEVLTIDRWGIRHRWDDGSRETERSIHDWLCGMRFDVALDLRHAPPALHQPVRRFCPVVDSDEAVEEEAVSAGADGVAAIQRAAVVGWRMPAPPAPCTSLHLPASAHRWAESLLRPFGGREPIGVAAVGSVVLKRWPPERFAAVADRLVAATDRNVLIFGSSREPDAAAVRAHMRHHGRAVLVPDHHLLRVAALLARLRLLLCNDSGLMHMAGAVGTPTVAVFGPTSRRIYQPPARCIRGIGSTVQCDFRSTASLNPSGCWGAGRCLIGERSCIDAVTEDEVLALAMRGCAAGRSTRRVALAPDSYS